MPWNEDPKEKSPKDLNEEQKEDSFSLNKIVKENRTYEVEEKEVDNTLISFLKNKIESKNKTYSLGEEVQKFIDKHKKDFEMVSKSQWGQIRAICQFKKENYKEEIVKIIWKKRYEMKKVITYGTYDLLHYGHIRLLERAKALGDYLIVGVTADDFDKAHALHEKMGCICFENHDMGIYFINDPDGYWIEIVPEK